MAVMHRLTSIAALGFALCLAPSLGWALPTSFEVSGPDTGTDVAGAFGFFAPPGFAQAQAQVFTHPTCLEGAFCDVNPDTAALFTSGGVSSATSTSSGITVIFNLDQAPAPQTPIYFQLDGPPAPEPALAWLAWLGIGAALYRARKLR